ncbi:vesicular transporter [Lentinula edodes]|uniref:Vacuolar protein sorting-associated protein 51 homolog n=1 Tax=Lentinula edodes TaxID=5353 RepID=A0A1Q3E0N6_LENED|nr:vesicular transporter [Lentinula edodes]
MSNNDSHRRSLPPAATGSPLRPTSPLATSSTSLPIQQANSSSPTRPLSRTPSTPPAKSTRARDLLRKHYGLGMGTPGSSGRGTPDDRDPMNMAYYSQLITTANLSTLLKKENELIGEIRFLDSERQNLVYNHHHELIAASDTIGAMKSHAESLDADLDLLKTAFSEISRLSTCIDWNHMR